MSEERDGKKKMKKKNLILGLFVLLVVASTMIYAINLPSIWPFNAGTNEGGEKVENTELNVQLIPKEAVMISNSSEIEAPIVSVTIFTNGIAYIKRKGIFSTDKKGEAIELVLLNFTQPIEDSMLVYDDKGEILGWSIENRMKTRKKETKRFPTFKELINESLGKMVEVKIKENEKIDGVVVWFDKEKLGIESEGKVHFLNVDELLDIIIKDVGIEKKMFEDNKTTISPDLVVKEKPIYSGAHNFLVTYLRSGVQWKMNYKFFTDTDDFKGDGTIQGWAKVSNFAREDWSNVELRLVVGYPNLITGFVSPYPQTRRYEQKTTVYADEAFAGGASPSIASGFSQGASVGEQHIYKFNELVTMNSSQEKNLPIFSEGKIEFKKKFMWDANYGADTVYKVYLINNTIGTPWAEGTFSVYLNGELEGQDRIKYTPTDREVKIRVSKAPDIVVKKEILERNTVNEGANGNIIKGGAIYSGGKYARKTYYKVKLTIENHKKTDAKVLITDQMQGGDTVKLISSTIDPTEVKLTSLKWDDLMLKKGQELEIIYDYEVTNWVYR